jgi:hypothetical protein
LLKTATLLALIGIILYLIPATFYGLANMGVIKLTSDLVKSTSGPLSMLTWLGHVLLIPFFVALYRNQK